MNYICLIIYNLLVCVTYGYDFLLLKKKKTTRLMGVVFSRIKEGSQDKRQSTDQEKTKWAPWRRSSTCSTLVKTLTGTKVLSILRKFWSVR